MTRPKRRNPDDMPIAWRMLNRSNSVNRLSCTHRVDLFDVTRTACGRAIPPRSRSDVQWEIEGSYPCSKCYPDSKP